MRISREMYKEKEVEEKSYVLSNTEVTEEVKDFLLGRKEFIYSCDLCGGLYDGEYNYCSIDCSEKEV
jgi:hypothetical protein